MADASSRIAICQTGADQSARRVSQKNLLAYVREQLVAAREYPKTRLLRREFRLARLNMTVWFSSHALARLCEKAIYQRQSHDPWATYAEIHVIDACAPDWEPPAL